MTWEKRWSLALGLTVGMLTGGMTISHAQMELHLTLPDSLDPGLFRRMPVTLGKEAGQNAPVRGKFQLLTVGMAPISSHRLILAFTFFYGRQRRTARRRVRE